MAAAVDAVEVLDERVRGQAGAEHARDVLGGPGDDLAERLPEGLQVEGRVGDVGAGDDERVQARRLEVREVGVVGLDVGARLRAAGQAGDAEGVDVDLGDAVAGADEAHVLLLGHQQRGVRHHVQQADVELADVLRLGALDGEDVLALGTQALERRQRVVGDERHGRRLRSMGP